MKFYHVFQDMKNDETYELDASHEWGMPGIKCSKCGQTWAMVGVEYPLVDLSDFPYKDLYQPWPVSVKRFLELRDLVKPLVPDDLIIPPGTEFGALVGNAKGEFGDFAWLNPWTLLVNKDTLAKLAASSLQLPEAGKTKMISDPLTFDFLEFQIEPLASLSPISYPSSHPIPCPLCGRICEKPERKIINKNSIPPDVDLFRIKDFSTYIIASEQFVEVIQSLNLTGISVTTIDIA